MHLLLEPVVLGLQERGCWAGVQVTHANLWRVCHSHFNRKTQLSGLGLIVCGGKMKPLNSKNLLIFHTFILSLFLKIIFFKFRLIILPFTELLSNSLELSVTANLKWKCCKSQTWLSRVAVTFFSLLLLKTWRNSCSLWFVSLAYSLGMCATHSSGGKAVSTSLLAAQ